MELSNLMELLLLVPLVAAVVMAIIPSKSAPVAVYEALHTVSVVVVCVLGVFLALNVMVTNDNIFALSKWFNMDSLAAIFVILIGVIGCMTGLFSIPYIRHDIEAGNLDKGQTKIYYVFFSLFVFTMLMAVLSNNIIMMWASVEATTLSTVFLVAAYSKKKLSLEAGWKYIIVCTAGVAFGLYATVLTFADANTVLSNSTDAVLWTSILPVAHQFDPMLMSIAFVFAVIGFGTKAGLFPMHTWLPDAHSEAPSPVSALLSGVLLKCALLVIIRFYVLTCQAVGPEFPQLVMLIIGALSVVVAAVSMYAQNDLKRKLAYSSCENVGFVALCLGFGGPIGVVAALLHCIFHGFTKALMFCLSGNILMTYGTRDLKKIKGVAHVAPFTGTLLGVGFFALAGMPPFAMFTSEITAFIAGIASNLVWLVVVVGLALTIVMAACVKVVTGSVLSKAPEGMEKGDVPAFAFVPEIILLVVILWFGIAMPQPIIQGVENATGIVLQQNTKSLHHAPIVKDIFAHTNQSGM